MIKVNIQLFAKGGRGGKRKRGGGSGKWAGGNVGREVPATLKEALGKKGKPMSEADAWFDANPFFSDNYKEFSFNCQRCVFAYEMRRRGYDVEAQPTYQGDTMPINTNWTKAMSGMTEASVGRSTEKATLDAIRSQMAKWGNGSRAIVKVRWAGGNSGHVFNVEYTNNKLHVYDVQSNKRTTGEQYIKDALPYTTLRYTTLYRTDNAQPTDEMRKMVYTKKK